MFGEQLLYLKLKTEQQLCCH